MRGSLTRQINFQVDAPKGVLPLREHCVKNSEGKIKLDVPLSDDVTPTWRALEAVSWPELLPSSFHCLVPFGFFQSSTDAQLVEKGLVKSIGISNLNINRSKKVLAIAKIKPVASASSRTLTFRVHHSRRRPD